ncbi:MAG: hypothetical protein GDA56_17125 [Hormoscilla sp. GM7CHS1pb]|nr:hypothetical protein [Hormoscilla sp. GM7CHS1pb]
MSPSYPPAPSTKRALTLKIKRHAHLLEFRSKSWPLKYLSSKGLRNYGLHNNSQVTSVKIFGKIRFWRKLQGDRR